MEEKYQLISALVVFDYFDQEGKDVNSILDSFVIYAIKELHLNSFTHLDICQYMEKEFGFKIPQLVVRQRLKSLKNKYPDSLSIENKEFKLLNSFEDKENIKTKISNATKDEDCLFEKLFSFIEIKLGCEILENEKEIIKSNFINYFLGNIIEDKYKIYLHAFIVENEGNETLKNIANGIVVYNGLLYQNTFEERKFEYLKIYLNMEIIFHYMGYNGILFKQIVDELFEIIDNINKKKKLIQLYYTREVKDRIDEFFKAVLKNLSIQKNTASEKIIEKCGKDSIKIRHEKNNLYNKISQNGFMQEKELPNINYLEPNNQYNISSIETLAKNKKIEDIEEILEFLNKLSILRKNHNCTIENARYIFLTEDKDYNNISNLIKNDNKEQKIPLVLNIQYLTNILWHKVGSRLANKKKMPLLFKADSRAKISLALEMHNCKDLLYKEINERQKEIDISDAEKIIYEIKSISTNPDNIDSDTTEFILEIFSKGLEFFIEKQEKEKSEKRQLEDENRNLKKENEVLSQKMIEMEQQRLDKEKQIEKENTIKKLKKKIIILRIILIFTFIVIICGLIIIPKEWLEKISLWLSIIGGGGLIWLYNHFQNKIETMQNKIKEINND